MKKDSLRTVQKPHPLVIVTKIESNPFALSLSKDRSWFNKPVLSDTKGLTKNGIRDVNSEGRPMANHLREFATKIGFSLSVVPMGIGMMDCEEH